MTARLSIVDTGILVAAALPAEPEHRRAAGVLRAALGPRLVPAPVIVETLFLIQRAQGSRVAAQWLRRFLAARPAMAVVDPDARDLERAAELLDEYADARLDFADSVIVAIAERLGVTQVLTLDRRHFALIQPRHCVAFEILP